MNDFNRMVEITSRISDVYGIDVEVLRGDTRRLRVHRARQHAFVLIRQLTNLPLTELAAYFNRDRSTISSAITKAIPAHFRDVYCKDLETDPIFTTQSEWAAVCIAKFDKASYDAGLYQINFALQISLSTKQFRELQDYGGEFRLHLNTPVEASQ